MTRFYLNTKDKKILVNRLGELTGEKLRYTYVPRCAYECGPYTVEKNGELVAADDADPMILQTLLDEGLVIGNLEQAGDAMQENTEPGTDAAEDSSEENAEDDVKEGAEVRHHLYLLQNLGRQRWKHPSLDRTLHSGRTRTL